ncbi:protein of unknown function [Modestobacter italicus]|uniref:Uncharacterized protein n=1 Tax=Modestobacter italicus (strain DSM 44449 / CECT 9708 / BC 501) TaxID=2732864 RepID=I4ERY6_MODI5|nr:hypothetical protein [Modestobacter marinus]CCH86149.1 protein of unknown function [Modestobacter marinus]
MNTRAEWPDAVALAHWQRALRSAAERLRKERGLTDPCGLTVEDGALWVNYGDLRVRVAGAYADPLTAEGLFDEIDSWAAFDREGGPGTRLDRDLQAMAEWRAQIPVLQRLWEDVAPRVFQDVQAAAGRAIPWRVAIRETEVAWKGLAPPPARQGVWGLEGEVSLQERALDFPDIVLELPHAHIYLPRLEDVEDFEEVTTILAGAVQDEVIEEVHGAWPKCLQHEHPMLATREPAGRAIWQCPQDTTVWVHVGEWGNAASSAADR